MTNFDLLIQQFPPERQAEVALVLDKLSNDPDSPSYCLYAEILSRCEKLDTRLAEAFASAEKRENQLPEHLAKVNAENRKTIRTEIGSLNRDSYWHSIITSKVIGAIVWTVCVMASSFAIQKIFLLRELAPLQEIINAHREAMETISNDPESLVAFSKYTREANKDALQIAGSLHAINSLIALPKSQMSRSDDGFLIITGDPSRMQVGKENGKNWVKLANPQALFQPETPLAIMKANEAQEKLDKANKPSK